MCAKVKRCKQVTWDNYSVNLYVMTKKKLSPEAMRAIEEANERRRVIGEEKANIKELGGPKGKEPTRYGDWERKGIAYDF